jgi:deoxyribodipyrimidine photo-lyase
VGEEPIILWFRQDLRLADNPALRMAAASGRPIIPLFVLTEASDGRAWGGASSWWLERSLASLDADLRRRGSRLVLRRGDAAEVIQRLATEVGASAVFWNRLYGPHAVGRDTCLKADLTQAGIRSESFNAALLIEPWELKAGTGGAYKVFTPFWRAARAQLDQVEARGAPQRLHAPLHWPSGERLSQWRLYPAKPDWASGFTDWTPGEAGAQARLDQFLHGGFAGYADHRDEPSVEATSRLSPHLHWGEIGPRQVWRAAQAAAASGLASERQLDKLLAELGWREFNHHLLFDRPDLATANFKPAFDALRWRKDPAGLRAWQTGLTGYPIVDAGMRQLWTTGWMHNRVRLIVGSFLVKHLLVDWREGERWFWDTLVDADEANNPANWQWVAGTGADASPFFRIFNPVTQGDRFDPEGAYVRRWVPELAALPDKVIHKPWTCQRPPAGYPAPVVDHGRARARALEAFKGLKD